MLGWYPLRQARRRRGRATKSLGLSVGSTRMPILGRQKAPLAENGGIMTKEKEELRHSLVTKGAHRVNIDTK